MKRVVNVLSVGAVFLACVAADCNPIKPTGGVPADAILSVSVTPSSSTIQVGQTVQLTETVDATGNAARTVTWLSSNAAVATVGATGIVRGLAPGFVTISAQSTFNPGMAGAVVVAVTAAPPTAVSGTYNVTASKTTDTGCNFLSGFNGQFQISGNTDGTSATFRMLERLTRAYTGTVQVATGTFSATGSGDFDGFAYTGSVSGQGTATTIQGIETLNFSTGCPGRQVVYSFTGTR